MKRICVYQSLAALPDSYRRVFDAGQESGGFFLSFAWFDNLIRHSLSIEHSIRLFGVEDDSDGKAYALLPMCFVTARQRWYAPRKLVAASNYYSSLFSLIHADTEQQVQENTYLLASEIINKTSHWDCIDLHPMARDSGQFESLRQAFLHSGAFIQTYFCFGNWYLKVNGRTFQEYFHSLPSRLKNTINRKSKQLEKSHGLHIKLIQSADELIAATAAYEQVYQSSWKLPEAHPLFISSLMQTCAQRGWLRLGIAYVGEQPVAAQLWIVHQRVASIYKLAYDEKFGKLSIGSILTSRMMEHVIDIDHVDEVDYLTGDDGYKQDWMSNRRERWGLIVFNQRTLKGNLSAFWHLGRQELKKRIASFKGVFERNSC
ncbi:MAG: GNAT family N-acetyltransferase [Undibacterium sp.]|nr:GNAT family N-acetyltransferase [Undibacterium sp.]